MLWTIPNPRYPPLWHLNSLDGVVRLAEAVREVMPTGVALDVAVAQESGRRLKRAVRDAMRAAGRDEVSNIDRKKFGQSLGWGGRERPHEIQPVR